MLDHEGIIQTYFDAWLRKDGSRLGELFDEQVCYCESYGPEYRGLAEVKRWFSDWSRRGSVLKWQIKRVISRGNLAVAEWRFACEYDGEVSEFDGVSVVAFTGAGKIVRLEEYQSKAEHTFPYRGKKSG